MKTWLKLAATAAAICTSVPLGAVTYIGNHTVGTGTISVSITTDDTIGVLSQSNITDWSFLLTNSGGSETLDSSNSLFTYFSGTALSATASDLIFDFSGTGHMQWDNFASAGGDAYCLDTVGAAFTCTGNPPGEVMVVNGAFSSENRTGRFVLGSAVNAAVPEPSSWAMMLLGFGGIGYSMRRRRKSAAIAQLT